MRKPKIARCPVCDTYLRTKDNPNTEMRFGSRSEPVTVEPECEKGDFFQTELPTIENLYWRCKVCGAIWRHSSYEEKETEEN